MATSSTQRFVFLLGMALGLGQGSLAFAFQVAITGSEIGYFVTMVAWCSGSALGLARTRVRGPWWPSLLALLGCTLVGTALMFRFHADVVGWWSGALFTVAAGFFGGRLLARCDLHGVPPGILMAWENTGFVLSFCATVVGLLWFGVAFYAGFVALVWIMVLAAPVPADPARGDGRAGDAADQASAAWVLPRDLRRRRYGISVALAASCFLLYTCFAWPGYWQWDGLMTATAVHDFARAPWDVLLYFAHTPVIPLTRAFHLANPTGDPMLATAVRESLCAAANVGLLFLFLSTLLRRELPALLLAVAWMVSEGHWRLASGGEEKDFLILIGMPYLLGFYQILGWFDLGFPFSTGKTERSQDDARRRRRRQAVWLGVFLAVACIGHLESGLLVIMTILVFPLRRRMLTHPREEVTVLALILGTAGVLTAAWYGFVLFGVNGFRSLDESRRWFLEYHLSGEFHRDPDLVQSYRGFRGYLLGDERREPGHGQLLVEAIVMSVLMGIAAVRGARFAPRVVAPALVLLALKALHFRDFIPEFPEVWGGAAFVGLVVVGAGAFPARRAALRRGTVAVATVLVVLLAGANLSAHMQRSWRYDWMSRIYRHDPERVASPAAAAMQRHLPLANLVRVSARFIEPGSIVFVDERELCSYLRIHTDLEPIFAPYFDEDRDELIRNDAMSQLSRRYYLPRRNAAQLSREMRAGRRVYALTEEDAPDERVVRLLAARTRLVEEIHYRDWAVHELIPVD